MSEIARAASGALCVGIAAGVILCKIMQDEGASSKTLKTTAGIIGGFGALILILLGPIH